MPLITCEMRWLFDGALPDAVERWFEAGPGRQPAAPAWREDCYLILPGVLDMGIKRREGRLEIKGRTGKLGVHTIGPGIEGNAERWCKWSYEAGSIAAGLRFCLEGEGTVVVGKSRLQRHFLLEAGGRSQEAPQRDLSRRGFSMEITRLRLGAAADDSHWSLGIEAAPDDAAMLADLLCVMPGVLRDFPMPLPRSRSMPYSEWLVRLEPDA
jgi:hypothetical protein